LKEKEIQLLLRTDIDIFYDKEEIYENRTKINSNNILRKEYINTYQLIMNYCKKLERKRIKYQI
jgi:hypothetical protein